MITSFRMPCNNQLQDDHTNHSKETNTLLTRYGHKKTQCRSKSSAMEHVTNSCQTLPYLSYISF